MPTTIPRLYRKLLMLGILVAAFCAIQESAPKGHAQLGCGIETFEYCDQFGLWVNPMTCGCAAYCPLVSADCQEVGKTLDYESCQCVGGWLTPIGICDSDPYALGCPRSFDTVFGGVTPGYGWGLCPSGGGSTCTSMGGSYNYNTCTCTIASQTGFCSAAAQNACTGAGGTVNTQNCTCKLP